MIYLRNVFRAVFLLFFVFSFFLCSNPSVGKTTDRGKGPLKAGTAQRHFLTTISGDTIKDSFGRPVEFSPYSLEWINSEDSKLNLSFLLDSPAGRDGFIRVANGHFVKPSGERFKIWGINLSSRACFPEKKDAAAYASFLARFGVNMVRIHHFENTWSQDGSVINLDLDNTRELHPDQLDKLDYFVAELIKAGIYINFNLNTSRRFMEGDGVPEHEILGTAKGANLFDDHLIKLQKEFAKQLLTHVNPYTGNAYIHEPGLAIVEIVNENSLIGAWFSGRLLGERTTPGGGIWADIPSYYGKVLTEKYNNWLKENISLEDIAAIKKEAGVRPGTEIPRLTPEEFEDASDLRFRTEARFIIETERDFYTSMYSYLKDDLGLKSLVIANSDQGVKHKSSYALLSNTSLLDIINGHAYWQLPTARTDRETGESYRFIRNTPMVNSPGNSTFLRLSRAATEGVPFIVTETNHPFPSEHAGEGIPILGGYGLLQDWDGIFYYTLSHRAPHDWHTSMPGPYDIVTDPVKMANFAATGLMFSRGDIKPAATTIYRGYDENEIIEGIRKNFGPAPFFTEGFSPLTPLVYKTRIKSFEKKISDFPQIEDKPAIRAETGEITWHDTGNNIVEISSPRGEALIGFMQEKANGLKHLKVQLENEFASVILVSLDDKPIESSGKLLLVPTARKGFTGMKWNDDRTRLYDMGERPSIIEAILGEIKITGLKGAQNAVIEPLDGRGNPMASIKRAVEQETLSINMDDAVTVWYYIEIKR